MESFAALLQRGRVASGLSYQRIAELVGRSPATVRSWERGKSTPTDSEVVAALAAVLDVSEEELLTAAGLAAEAPASMFADLAPADLAPDDLAADDLAPADLAPDVLAPDDLAPDDLAAGEVAPEYDLEVEEPTVPEPEAEAHAETSLAGPSHEPPQVASAGPSEDSSPPPEPLPPEPSDEPPADHHRARRPIPPAPRPSMPSPPTADPSYLEDGHQLMTYRLRAVLTVALGIILLLLLEWGLRGLGTSLKDLLGGLSS